MGRIAYLSKRGNIWWFRRRHPAIIVQRPQNGLKSGLCCPLRKRVQAKGHLAVSLGTTSVREARLLSAYISADFERAWMTVEAAMSQMDSDEDFIDAMAMAITDGFRRHIKILRAGGASGLNALVREKAFNILEAELRSALSVDADSQAPKSDVRSHVEDQDPEEYHFDSGATADDFPDFEDPSNAPWLPVGFGTEGMTQDEYIDNHFIQVFELGTLEFRASLTRYLEACERLGRDPLKETPVLELAIRETIDTARAHGLEKPVPETATTAIDRPEPVRKGPTPLFSAFAGSYLDLRSQGYTLRRDDESPHAATGAAFERTSLRNWQSSVRVFTEIVGDLALGAYTKDEVIEFNTMIQRLPANFGKSSRDMRTARQVIEDLDETEEQALNDLITDLRAKGRPSAEIEDAVAEAKTKRISATTVKRHQTALQSIFDHAFNQRLINSNPFKGRILTDAEVRRWQKSAARVERIGWGDAIYALLGSEIFRDPLSDIGEPLFWAPLIAMYGGLRLEEICQLRIRDFGTDDGVPFVAVQNELGSQSLKTNNSLRRVPLHQALIDLGLPQLVELRREQGMSRLFPDMNRSKSKGTLSAIMSKRFGYYIRSRGIKDEGLDFHALRTEFLVRLTRARVPDHVRKGLMGHDQTDVTHKNYFRAGERMSSLKDYIDRNDIDHSGVLSPFGRSVPLAHSKLRIVK